MNMKKIIISVSTLGVMVLYSLFHTRELGICDIYCGSGINKYQGIFLIFPFILFFSLVTYKMKESVFIAWWKFAQIAIPVIFIASFIISLGLHHNPGGFFNTDNEVDLVGYFILYSIFTIGSLLQIYRGFNQR